MATYFIYKEIIYECFICEFADSDCLEKAVYLICIPFFSFIGLGFILMDIISIPFYILVGVIALIIKIIELIRR